VMCEGLLALPSVHLVLVHEVGVHRGRRHLTAVTIELRVPPVFHASEKHFADLKKISLIYLNCSKLVLPDQN
jgi:hypothetical protein